jgi:DNA mismatch endonuclease, patch repair protein
MRPVARDPQTSQRLARQKQLSTGTELCVALQLRGLGIRYRKNVKTLPGSPDFANASKRWAIFVNGCFWHHHTNCRRATVPRNNEGFWRSKFARNRSRDARAIRELRRRGLSVLILWECGLASSEARLRAVLKPALMKPDEPQLHRFKGA